VTRDSPPSFHLVSGSDAADLQRLAGAIADFGARLGLPDALVGDFVLASEELMTNTISYGGAGLRIEAEMRLEDDHVVFVLIDNGVLFDPLSAPPPDLVSPLAERRIGGLGVHLVCKLMDVVRYDCQGGVNKTTIAKQFLREGSRNETETE
jgi:anti-sigma regulatory factor (Ser/Thr protein kinase)